ncbi:hypothetical protein GALL_521680 [mine drainage metagenome]|uniref:Uncharacterized protein n=1 Tax=mine drainage metagenome TaxID=410659 RepID=A0A1J5P521_9ZZZZ
MQQRQQFVPAYPQSLGGGIEVKPVPGLVLHLGQEDRLTLQRRCAGDPVPLGQLTHDFRMGMLPNLPDQRFAVALRHPFLRLDLLATVDALLKGALFRRHLVKGFKAAAVGLDHLGIHLWILPDQTRSIIIAMPCPTPMHIVQRA